MAFTCFLVMFPFTYFLLMPLQQLSDNNLLPFYILPELHLNRV